MSRTAWPTAADLAQWLASAGVMDVPPTGALAGLDLEAALAAGLSEWERATGFEPFEAAASDTARYYSPDGSCFLDLGAGLVAAPTSVVVGYSPTSAGTALTANQDYWLWPLNAIASGHPATAIRFAAPQRGAPMSIVITGKFGACLHATIPEDAWLGVMLAAAEQLLPQIEAVLSHGGMRSIQEGDVSYSYEGLASKWHGQWTSLANRYRRLWVR